MATGKNAQDKELFVVTCQLGLENVLAEELQSLGIKPHETIPSTVSFYGHLRELYLVNMNLRTALHILKPLKSFKPTNSGIDPKGETYFDSLTVYKQEKINNNILHFSILNCHLFCTWF